MIVTKDNIGRYLPQKSPFIMVDALISATETGFESQFTVRADNLFLEGETLMEPSLIENIAQTCGAGFVFLQSKGSSEPRLGFIGAITKLTVYKLPTLHNLIETRVSIIYSMENIFIAKGENYCNGERLLECEMKIVLN
jgi:predicted hotdog family 3-hydroxylacyl-ACP dehydratase